MPLYAYACKGCDKQFDEVHKVDDRAKPTEAPCECGGEIYIFLSNIYRERIQMIGCRVILTRH